MHQKLTLFFLKNHSSLFSKKMFLADKRTENSFFFAEDKCILTGYSGIRFYIFIQKEIQYRILIQKASIKKGINSLILSLNNFFIIWLQSVS